MRLSRLQSNNLNQNSRLESNRADCLNKTFRAAAEWTRSRAVTVKSLKIVIRIRIYTNMNTNTNINEYVYEYEYEYEYE